MLLKVVLRLVPSVLTTVMMATAMPAAMRPYSMAVAPLSFFRKLVAISTSQLTSRLPCGRPYRFGWRSTADVNCGSKNFLLFLAKDLVANDAAKPDATFDQTARELADSVGWVVAPCCQPSAQREY
jgi:hypothetical protein